MWDLPFSRECSPSSFSSTSVLCDVWVLGGWPDCSGGMVLCHTLHVCEVVHTTEEVGGEDVLLVGCEVVLLVGGETMLLVDGEVVLLVDGEVVLLVGGEVVLLVGGEEVVLLVGGEVVLLVGGEVLVLLVGGEGEMLTGHIADKRLETDLHVRTWKYTRIVLLPKN